MEDLGGARRGVGAELGPGPEVRATESGAGRETFNGGRREAFSMAGGFKDFSEVLGLLSGLSSVVTVLLFTQEEEEPP